MFLILPISIVAGIVLLMLAFFAVRAWINRRRAAGGKRLAETLHLNAKWWHNERDKPGELLYVAVGDSAAQGVGASKPGRSYVGLIAEHLRKRTGRTVRVVNLSVSGARIREALALQLPALRRLIPDVLTVAIGANDIASFDKHRFERELEELYSALPPGAVVADVPSFYVGVAERNAVVAGSIVRRLATKYGFPVAPLHATTRRQGVARYALNQAAADFFHPNDRGYRVWASAFLPVLDDLLPEDSLHHRG
ncbi:MAG TPA: SGNH/GDSL hydrolase family protein [Lacisediminihabitans sp.]|uniref:SGNH/GDSL hydrolase family protein n=1 Tax=Lacisediminihabitans sp. TaxID=2787631 RepID=UPI002EDA63CB